MKLIDADATKEKLGFALEPFVGSNVDEIINDTLLKAIAIVDSMPTVDAQLVTHGRWVDTVVRGCPSIYCSECGTDSETICPTDFCPNCGAKMDGGSGNDA